MVDGEFARSLHLATQFKYLCHSMAVLDPFLREACLSLGLIESYFESVVKTTASATSKTWAAHANPSQAAAAITQSPATGCRCDQTVQANGREPVQI